MGLKAFHGQKEIKQKYIDRVLEHRRLDHIVQGTGYENTNGKIRACAVGCTLDNYNHSRYPIELGIPEWLARLEDTIFEGLQNDKAMLWPEKFLESINVGADLEKIKSPFMVFILESCIDNMDRCVFDKDNNPGVVKVINDCKYAVMEMIKCHKMNAAWSAAESAAWSAAGSAAWSAAESAARSAGSAARSAESAARSAARSAAESAGSAAESAARSSDWSAAESAGSAAESAARSAARSAESAESAAYEQYSEKLIELLKECK